MSAAVKPSFIIITITIVVSIIKVSIREPCCACVFVRKRLGPFSFISRARVKTSGRVIPVDLAQAYSRGGRVTPKSYNTIIVYASRRGGRRRFSTVPPLSSPARAIALSLTRIRHTCVWTRLRRDTRRSTCGLYDVSRRTAVTVIIR